MRHFKNLINLCVIIVVFSTTLSQSTFGHNSNNVQKNVYESIEDYIQDYKDMAISEMHRARIPASITLAQAIIESNFGNSYLARVGKNHFGIKCHKSWTGKAVFRDDDEKNECFRSYPNDYESYQDHSHFLQRSRYEELFRLSMNDYRGWAKGLKKNGYATDPTYDKQLIYVIEKYNLTQFDIQDEIIASAQSNNTNSDKKGGFVSKIIKRDKPSSEKINRSSNENTSKYEYAKKESTRSVKSKSSDYAHSKMSKKLRRSDIFYYNHIKSVVTNADATPTQIASAYGIRIDKLCKFNDFDSNERIPANTKVYLQSKRNKGPKNIYTHKVKIGETIEDIAHHYGIKNKKIYKRNYLNEGDQPAPGAVIFLRGKAVTTPELMEDYEREQRIATKYNRSNKGTNGTVNKNAKVELIQPVKESKPVSKAKDTYIPDEFKSKSATVSNSRQKTVNSNSNGSSKYVYKNSQPTKQSNQNTEQSGTHFDLFAEKKVTESTIEKPVRQMKTTTSNSYFDSYTDNNITTKPIMTTESVKVETPTSRSTPAETVVNKRTSSSNYSSKEIVIKKGDTLYSISKKYGVTVEDIQNANSLASNTIKIGQKLTIPVR